MTEAATWKHGDPTPNLNASLAKAQGVMEAARKDSENPAFKRDGKASTYADLASVIDAIRKPFADNGLSFVQTTRNDPAGVTVTTHLLHASGEERVSDFWVPVGAATAQGYGAACTYARRFSLQAMAGVAANDDDGNEASRGAEAKREFDRAIGGLADHAAEKVKADRIAAWHVDAEKLSALGVSPSDLVAHLGRQLPPDGTPTNDEWAKLRRWGAELKKAKDSDRQTVSGEMGRQIDAHQKRLNDFAKDPSEVEPTDEQIATERAARQKEADKAAAAETRGTVPQTSEQMERALKDSLFNAHIGKVRAAKTEQELALMGAEFAATPSVAWSAGEKKAYQRASTDRLLILHDSARQSNKPKTKEEVF